MRAWLPSLGAAAFTLVSSMALAGPMTDPVNAKGLLKGTVDATFNTKTRFDTSGRAPDGAPALGAADVYAVNVAVADQFRFQGNINVLPWIPTRTLGVTLQGGAVTTQLAISALQGAQSVGIGNLVGGMSVDGDGKYRLDTPPRDAGNLRFAMSTVGRVQGFTSNFKGEIQGRIPEQAGLAAKVKAAGQGIQKTYVRYVNGKPVPHTVKNADPMKFTSAMLASGPSTAYPDTQISGSIDWVDEEKKWYVDITATYAAEGKQNVDRYSGSIDWFTDADRKSSGKGWYDFNIRLNEKAASQQDFFTGPMNPNDYFATDTSVPGFTGRVEYIDKCDSKGCIGDGEKVLSSKITYNVDANQSSPIQSMNLWKIIGILMVGPFNT